MFHTPKNMTVLYLLPPWAATDVNTEQQKVSKKRFKCLLPLPCFHNRSALAPSFLIFECLLDLTRHPSTDSTPSYSGSSPSDSCSSPSPSTRQKLLPACTSPFGPRIFHSTTGSSGSPRPQPEGSDHRHSTPRLSGNLGGHGPCGRHIPVKMERIKVGVDVLMIYLVYLLFNLCPIPTIVQCVVCRS